MFGKKKKITRHTKKQKKKKKKKNPFEKTEQVSEPEWDMEGML